MIATASFTHTHSHKGNRSIEKNWFLAVIGCPKLVHIVVYLNFRDYGSIGVSVTVEDEGAVVGVHQL